MGTLLNKQFVVSPLPQFCFSVGGKQKKAILLQTHRGGFLPDTEKNTHENYSLYHEIKSQSGTGTNTHPPPAKKTNFFSTKMYDLYDSAE